MTVTINGTTGITAPGLETFGDGTALGGATNPIVSMAKGANNYVQSYIINNTNGTSSSADFVAYPSNGADAHGWVDMGITSLGYADTTYTVTGPNESYLFASAPSGSSTTGNLVIATDNTGTANSIQFYTNGFTQAKSAAKMVIDGSTGNVGIGTSSPTAKLHTSSSAATAYATNYFENTASNGYVRLDLRVGSSGANGIASVKYAPGVFMAIGPDTNDTTTPLVFVTNNATERARIDSSGNLLVGTASGSKLLTVQGGSTGGTSVQAGFGGINATSFVIYHADAGGQSATATVTSIAKVAATNRSINAAGTINASGADYAEYMVKAGDFAVAKGDVIGINSDGKLTNVFADAVSFAVKSTNPSYVGGDVWGHKDALGLTQPEQPTQRQATEDVEAETDEEFAVRQAQYETDKAVFGAALEAARQTVDRIAFAGQVPVNVLGAVAGQYIVPVNDNGAIKGEAVSNPTFEQYQQAVGKVIAIEQDGRARIIVKVA